MSPEALPCELLSVVFGLVSPQKMVLQKRKKTYSMNVTRVVLSMMAIYFGTIDESG